MGDNQLKFDLKVSEALRPFSQKLAVASIPSCSELEREGVPDWPPGYDPAQGYRERQADGSPWSPRGTLLDFLNFRIIPTVEKLPDDLVQEVAELINDAHSLGQESALLPFRADMLAAGVKIVTCERDGCDQQFVRSTHGRPKRFCHPNCKTISDRAKNFF